MTPPRKQLRLVLIGLPSSGKSTVGRVLAARLGLPFIDADDRLLARVRRIEGRRYPSPRALFLAAGEAAFRRQETETLRELAADPRPAIYAAGGGAPARPANHPFLQALGTVVYLYLPIDEWERRMRSGKGLPAFLAEAPEPDRALREFWNRRHAACQSLADRTVDAAAPNPEQVAGRLLDAWNAGLD